MKLYKNISRFRWRRMFSKGGPEEERLLWGASLKPGDIIQACTGFNVRIAKITPERSKATIVWSAPSLGRPFNGRAHGWFISDFLVEDESGGGHYIMSCCWKRETVAQIEEFWRGIPPRPDDEKLCRIQALLAEGKRICDDDGIIFPELITADYNLGRKDPD